MSQANHQPREFDILVWGATGFTGKIVTQYLNDNYANSNLTWAMGGRSSDKLAAVKRELGIPDNISVLVGDSNDPAKLRELVSKARVVLTTVGPYAKYGSDLVAACAELGTHYCDLTGEVQWMRKMIDAHQATAEQSGARIVHTCGFDSIPSDLGTYFVQQEMRKRYDCASPQVKYRVVASKGGVSGGTIDSMMTMMDEGAVDPGVLDIIADPYALNPAGGPRGLDGPDKNGASFDPDLNTWVGPFVMAAINTRVVRRTNALLDFAYGHDFRYDEATIMGSGPMGGAAAAAMSLGTAAFTGLASIGPARNLLKNVLPKPGEGPSPETQRTGHFHIKIFAKHPTDPSKSLIAHVKGDRDPGYGSTAKMLSESAICLAQDALKVGGGIWTPAAAMGDQLLQRLPANAGVTFDIED